MTESFNILRPRNFKLEKLLGLLEKDPKRRIGWQQILRHPFLKERLEKRIDKGPKRADLTSSLTESQELAKEIQRQDKAKLLPGKIPFEFQNLKKT